MEDYRLEQTGQEVQDILNGAAMQSDVTTAVETLQGNIDTEETRAKAAEKQNADDIDAIEEKIPSGASSANKLATEGFVNDAVSTASATFQGTYNLVSDLHLAIDASYAQIANALGLEISGADNNDYCFVQVPTSAETPTEIAKIERYKFNGTAWAFEYDINNSGFTTAQWASINSGISSGDVAKLSALPTNAQLTTLLNGKQDSLTFDSVPVQGSNNPVKSGGVYSAIDDEKGARLNSDALLQQAIEAILVLIPSAATALNQLADKSFVNSSIATASATFRGTYNLVSDLHLTTDATHAQIAAALDTAISSEDNNDYAFVQIPTSDETPTEIAVTERYKFNGTTWVYEYDLNNSGFTAAQWAAINSAITSALVSKLAALPTNAELTTALAGKQAVLTFDSTPTQDSNNPVKSGGVYDVVAAINSKIPSSAAPENKLVDEDTMETYVTAIINALDATYNLTSSDGHITLVVTQTNGAITDVQIAGTDIASASALTSLTGRVSTNEQDIEDLQLLYNALQQSAPMIIEPTDTWPVANPSTTVIYRVVDRTHTPPQYYSDYMYNGTSFVLMAQYDNAIDAVPTAGSNNLVKSGGVESALNSLEVVLCDVVIEYSNTGSRKPLSIPLEVGSVIGAIGGSSSVILYEEGSTTGYIELTRPMLPYVCPVRFTHIASNTGNGTITTVGKISKADIADNLITDSSTKVLSAKQGKILNEKIENYIDGIEFITFSNTGSKKPLSKTIHRGDVITAIGGAGNLYLYETQSTDVYTQLYPALLPFVATSDYTYAASNQGDGTITIEGQVNDFIKKGDIATIIAPKKICAVVGDTLQMFVRGICRAYNPYSFPIGIQCNKGNVYPRYFQCTPIAEDVGNHTIQIQQKTNENRIVSQSSLTMQIVGAGQSPSTNKNILVFGDSLTSGGQWVSELVRRLTGTGGSPEGRGLNNLSFCGAMGESGRKFFGVGGWSWSNYTTNGGTAYRFIVSGVTSCVPGAQYTNNGSTFRVLEVNLTNGAGNILCQLYRGSAAPEASGSLVKSSGDGDAAIAFSSNSLAPANPLWDANNQEMSFAEYASNYANNQIDVVYVMLGTNDITAYKTDFTTTMQNVKTFADTLHSEFPSAKLKIVGLAGTSINGGMREYGASAYADQFGMLCAMQNLNIAYSDFAASDGYSSFVEFVDVMSQFDMENNFPSTETAVNLRNPKTELVGSNGVHPSNYGYYQIADVVYRNVIKELCQ